MALEGCKCPDLSNDPEISNHSWLLVKSTQMWDCALRAVTGWRDLTNKKAAGLNVVSFDFFVLFVRKH